MKGSVLLVDDEPAIVKSLAMALRAKDYFVREVEKGADALYALTEEVPDVILLDINLPDITGWEVLRRLSPADRQRVPVIVFSASPLAPGRLKDFRPDGVLLKPFPIDALERLLAEVIASNAGKKEEEHA